MFTILDYRLILHIIQMRDWVFTNYKWSPNFSNILTVLCTLLVQHSSAWCKQKIPDFLITMAIKSRSSLSKKCPKKPSPSPPIPYFLLTDDHSAAKSRTSIYVYVKTMFIAQVELKCTCKIEHQMALRAIHHMHSSTYEK